VFQHRFDFAYCVAYKYKNLNLPAFFLDFSPGSSEFKSIMGKITKNSDIFLQQKERVEMQCRFLFLRICVKLHADFSCKKH